MKRIILLAVVVLVSMVTFAQNFCLSTDHVGYAYPLEKVGDITFSSNSFTFAGQNFDAQKPYTMTYNENSVKDNRVSVTYNGNTADVVVSGNLYGLVEVKVNGAHVTVLQASNVVDEITYTLIGKSDNGSFYMDGDLKATIELKGVSLHNPDSAAINIQDGKRIAVELKSGTSNVVSDGNAANITDGDAHNACFYVDGHTEFSGSGSLTINGNVKHGFTSDEYCQVKKSTGTITVASAPGDGFHIGQYYLQQGGTITITCMGDGIDVGAKKDPATENNGQVMLEDGVTTIYTNGDATKGIKCDNSLAISGGTYNITVTGKAYFDTEEIDISSASGLKPGTTFTMTGGDVTVLATNAGGKGLNAGGAVVFDGGKFSAVTCGEVFKYGSDDTKPQGVKSDGNITINDGEVYVAASKDKGTAFKTDYSFIINGGTVMGIGGKSVTAAAASKQTSKKYTSQNIAAGATATYDGVSFQLPAEYSNSAAYVIVSRAGL